MADDLEQWQQQMRSLGYSEEQIQQQVAQQGVKYDGDSHRFSLVQSWIVPLFFLAQLGLVVANYDFTKYGYASFSMRVDDVLSAWWFFPVLVGVGYGGWLFLRKKGYVRSATLFAYVITGWFVLLHVRNELVIVATLSIVVLIKSLMYYFKAGRTYAFLSVFISLFASLVLAYAIVTGAHVLFGWFVIPLFSSLHIVAILVYAALLFTLGVLVYVKFSVFLLGKLCGCFDYDAYFRYNHFPFTMWGWLASKQKNAQVTITRDMIAVFLLVLLVAGITTTISGIVAGGRADQWMRAQFKNTDVANIKSITSQVVDGEFTNLSTVLDINEDVRGELNEVMNARNGLQFPSSFSERVVDAWSFGWADRLTKTTMALAKLGLVLGTARADMKTAETEYAEVLKFRSSRKFYDNTTTLAEHSKRVEENGVWLEKQYVPKSGGVAGLDGVLDMFGRTIVGKATGELWRRHFMATALVGFSQEVGGLREQVARARVSDRGTSSNELDMLLRLKMREVALAEAVMAQCSGNSTCKNDVRARVMVMPSTSINE